MNTVFLLIGLGVILLWMIRSDAAILFAPVVTACSVKRSLFVGSVFFVLLLTWLLQEAGCLPTAALSFLQIGSARQCITLAVTALATVMLVERVGAFASISYALVGALVGMQWVQGAGGLMQGAEGAVAQGAGALVQGAGTLAQGAEGAVQGTLRQVIAWVAAPLAAFGLAALLYKGYSVTVGRMHVHMIRLYEVLKYFLYGGALLLTVAFALNYGSLLKLFRPNGYLGVLLLGGIAFVIYLLTARKTDKYIRNLTEREFDVNFPCSLSVIYSTAFVLFLGTRLNVVLAAPHLILFALLGVGLAQHRDKMEGSTVGKMILGLALTPVVAFMLSYGFRLGTWPHRDPLNGPYFFIVVLAVAGTALLSYLYYKQRLQEQSKHASYTNPQQQLFENQKALNALDVKSVLAENQNLYKRLEQKRGELINVALNISEQKEFIATLYSKAKAIDALPTPEEKESAVKELQMLLLQRKSFSQEMDSFYTQVELLHKDFTLKLNEKFPLLTAQEKKLATLLRLGFSSKELATLMNISAKSAEISRYRLRKKLNLTREDNLIAFIKSI